MKGEYTADEFKFKGDLNGITLKMLEEHFKLYSGYIKKANEIQEKIALADKAEANAAYSYIGELKRQETFSVNGIKLHEAYFAGLASDSSDGGVVSKEPGSELSKMIETDFGKMENWREDIVATGISARGWAVLAFDFRDNKLHNYGADAHNAGSVWGALPLVALDVYEHAYFLDYGVNRKDYIASFFKNLDWDFANKTVHRFDLAKWHTKGAEK